MQYTLIVLGLLFAPYIALAPLRASRTLRARLGIALVFAVAGVVHFVKPTAMAQMLPPWVPLRVPLVYVTGVFELLAAVAILSARFRRPVGIALCIFLVLVLPANIYAAMQRLDFGGHGEGPAYLLLRVPLQLILIGWIYWFAIRREPVASSKRAPDQPCPRDGTTATDSTPHFTATRKSQSALRRSNCPPRTPAQ